MDFLQFLPDFGNLAFTLASFIVAILVIVFVHEYGHYIVGRWSGIKAEVFSLGFGPVIWSRADKRGTQWQIAAIPLGGYVKFLGDADPASMNLAEGEAIDPKQARHTMRYAPLWARAATVLAGPVFNFILSIVIFAGLMMARGVAVYPLAIEEMPQTPYVNELQQGDVILSIDGAEVPDLSAFDVFVNNLPAASEVSYEVRRGDDVLTVTGPHPYPAIISGVSPDSAAADAQLEPDDFILSVNESPTGTFTQLQAAVAAAEGQEVALKVWRKGEVLDYALTPRIRDLPLPEGGFETRYLIGVNGGLWFEPVTESPPLSTTIGTAFERTFFVVTQSISGLYHILSGDISTCNMTGMIRIAETAGTVAGQGLLSFLGLIALLSSAIGILNLFPIPVLDGGHLVFYTYEAVRGRPPSDRILGILTTVGLALILSMMVFALSNDIFCP